MIKTGIACYGCGVCVVECKFSAITMNLNSDGFLAPSIDEKKCISCGQCDKVCSFFDPVPIDQNDKTREAVYSAVTKDNETLRNTTSGGVAYELGRICIKNGYSVIGCTYDYSKQIALHIIVNTEEELKQTMGSKYIQSWVSDALLDIDINKNYAVFGTPCQIDSLRRFVREKKCEQKWIFIDFFCHGVPSYRLWEKYLHSYTRNETEVDFVKFRDKINGWGVYSMTMTMTMTNGKRKSCTLGKNDFFLNMFLGNYILNDPCYSCKFHGLKSPADIRIGDFWGKKYENNKTGVSLVVALTKTGNELFKRTEDYCLIVNETIDNALEGQLIKNIPVPKNRERILAELKTNKSLKKIYYRYCFKQWRSHLIPKFIKKTIHFLLKNRNAKDVVSL